MSKQHRNCSTCGLPLEDCVVTRAKEEDTAPRYVKRIDMHGAVNWLRRSNSGWRPFEWSLYREVNDSKFTRGEAHALRRLLPGSVVVKGKNR